MPADITVFVPIGMRSLTGGQRVVRVSGRTVAAVVDDLEALYPGFAETLVEDGRLRRGLTIAVNSVEQPLGLLAKVPQGAEVHILPAMAGGGFCVSSNRRLVSARREGAETLRSVTSTIDFCTLRQARVSSQGA